MTRPARPAPAAAGTLGSSGRGANRPQRCSTRGSADARRLSCCGSRPRRTRSTVSVRSSALL